MSCLLFYYLDDAGFVSDVEIHDEEVEIKQPTNHPQDCLLTVCGHKKDSVHGIHYGLTKFLYIKTSGSSAMLDCSRVIV
ncbi:hypothetical protein AB4571_05840 [Vibrio breoganii]